MGVLFSAWLLVCICSALLPDAVRAGTPRGALISVRFTGTVGVRLSEVPVANGFRDRVADVVKKQPEAFWIEKAKRQTWLTTYRQVFRPAFYDGKKQLTLPPEEKWTYSFEKPKRTKYKGRKGGRSHDYVSIKYKFYSVLLGTASTVKASEPLLDPIGGKYSDSWNLPIDPELLFQRTGLACMDESEFPRGSVDSENVAVYYDDSCEAEDPFTVYNATDERCHFSGFPELSCVDSLIQNVGMTTVKIKFKRVPWSASVADKWRHGKQIKETADLIGLDANLHDNRLVYRYYDEASCVLKEGSGILPSCKDLHPTGPKGCVGAPGWRRLLQFTATEVNAGKTDLEIGIPSSPELLKNHVYIYDPCHQHYHFEHYGLFYFGNIPGRKTGFCLQTTWRYHNNEDVSFNTKYDECAYQGIAPGWGDDYKAGLDCQWIDVTDAKPQTAPLGVFVNSDEFLCEGLPQLYPNGSWKFVDTEYCAKDGSRVMRQNCKYTPGFYDNNRHSIPYTLVANVSMVTQACKRWMVGHLRNCGFSVHTELATCTPGKRVFLKVKLQDKKAPVAIRICESSHKLRRSTACEELFALTSVTLYHSMSTVTFTCPEARDHAEKGGLYSILVAPVVPGDPSSEIKVKGYDEEDI